VNIILKSTPLSSKR